MWHRRVGTRLIGRPQTGIYALAAFGSTLLASGDDDGVVRVWDVRAARAVRQFAELEDYVGALHFAGDGTRLLTAGGCGHVAELDVAHGALVARSDPLESECTSGALIKHETAYVVRAPVTRTPWKNAWQVNCWTPFSPVARP